MQIATRIIDAVPQPMIYVTTRTTMQPKEVSAAMERSFALLGRFMQESGTVPLAAPLAIYRDWNGRLATVDVGFPVSQDDATKAMGEVKSGHTPGGAAIKTVHNGSYATLGETYAQLDNAMTAQGLRTEGLCWEVYFGEPGKTPEQDLVTEIYMQLAEAGTMAARSG